jgi:transcriptional regulator with XRE-family HTH domain
LRGVAPVVYVAGVTAPLAAERLQAWLDSSGLTQVAFAQRLDVTVGAVRQWLSGAKTPSLEHAVQMEKICAVPARLWLRPA